MINLSFCVYSEDDISLLNEELKKYFKYEVVKNAETMGIEEYQFIFDNVKNGIKVLKEIIATWLNANRTTIELKNGDKSVKFNGGSRMWTEEEVNKLMVDFFEVTRE